MSILTSSLKELAELLTFRKNEVGTFIVLEAIKEIDRLRDEVASLTDATNTKAMNAAGEKILLHRISQLEWLLDNKTESQKGIDEAINIAAQLRANGAALKPDLWRDACNRLDELTKKTYGERVLH